MVIKRDGHYIVSQEQFSWMAFHAAVGHYAMNSKQAVVTIGVRRLPEGAWLATSDDIPGLIVETDSRDEAIDLAPDLARDLMEISGARPQGDLRFAFIFQ